MNRMKFRPVGQPSGPITEVRISQARRAIYPLMGIWAPSTSRGLSRHGWIRLMARRGFVPARG